MRCCRYSEASLKIEFTHKKTHLAWMGILLSVFVCTCFEAKEHHAVTYERVAEWTIESSRNYVDPFNDVDVDVIFSRDGQSWRVPTFWRGGQQWTVRFAPPTPGEYRYRLESTDKSNPDLNGVEGQITITPYTGTNPLFKTRYDSCERQ
jgi:hypothetical protein